MAHFFGGGILKDVYVFYHYLPLDKKKYFVWINMISLLPSLVELSQLNLRIRLYNSSIYFNVIMLFPLFFGNRQDIMTIHLNKLKKTFLKTILFKDIGTVVLEKKTLKNGQYIFFIFTFHFYLIFIIINTLISLM